MSTRLVTHRQKAVSEEQLQYQNMLVNAQVRAQAASTTAPSLAKASLASTMEKTFFGKMPSPGIDGETPNLLLAGNGVFCRELTVGGGSATYSAQEPDAIRSKDLEVPSSPRAVQH